MINGKVFKYGDNIDTDLIIPARRLTTSDPKQLGIYCFEDLDGNFIKNVKAGDIILGGKNFGCGSSREHAPIAIKAAGIGIVIAETFARIFYRNSINIGLPIMECKEAAIDIEEGDEITVDTGHGIIKNITKNKIYQASPFPDFMQSIMNSGGLINQIKKELVAE